MCPDNSEVRRYGRSICSCRIQERQRDERIQGQVGTRPLQFLLVKQLSPLDANRGTLEWAIMHNKNSNEIKYQLS
jgi:hypothetical protein